MYENENGKTWPGPSCTEKATTSVPADAAACNAVTALDDNTACSAVMTAASATTPVCTYSPSKLFETNVYPGDDVPTNSVSYSISAYPNGCEGVKPVTSTSPSSPDFLRMGKVGAGNPSNIKGSLSTVGE